MKKFYLRYVLHYWSAMLALSGIIILVLPGGLASNTPGRTRMMMPLRASIADQ
jgi:hypothetical protein